MKFARPNAEEEHVKQRLSGSVCAFGLVVAVFLQTGAFAVPIVFDPGSASHSRDIRTPNTSGFGVGDRQGFGVSGVTPTDVEGTTLTATQNGQRLDLFFFEEAGGNEFFRQIPFDPTLTGQWELTLTIHRAPIAL